MKRIQQRHPFGFWTGISFLLLTAALPNMAAAKTLPYTGTNLSGGEFYSPKPGETAIYAKNYIHPSPDEFDYFAAKGMNVFRLPFLWEILQPKAKADFDAAEFDRLKDIVKTQTGKGRVIILDPHNYARYYGKVIGGPDVSAEDFADFWARVGREFKNNSHVWFDLMNEPNGMPNELWRQDANAAIAALRKAGAKNFILVPGNSWTGAHSWISSGNGTEMLKIVDPQNHYAFDAHQYLDTDSSGSHPEAVKDTIGSERLKQFTQWCREHKKQAFLGEFGTGVSNASQTALKDMLTYMEANTDVWLGFTWWSAGPWWGDYMFTIEPKNGQERPQMVTLLPYLQKRTSQK